MREDVVGAIVAALSVVLDVPPERLRVTSLRPVGWGTRTAEDTDAREAWRLSDRVAMVLREPRTTGRQEV